MSTVFDWMARSFAPRRPWRAYDLILCLELSQLRRSVGLGCEVAFKFQPLLGSEGAKDVGAVPFREVDIPPFFRCDSQRSYRVVQPGFHRARRYLLLAGDVANGLAEGSRCRQWRAIFRPPQLPCRQQYDDALFGSNGKPRSQRRRQ